MPRKGKGRRDTEGSRRTEHIMEIYASTKAYPSWWSEIDEQKVFQRRKSIGDTVLERNLCFVDTPGYGGGLSGSEEMGKVSQYIESQLTKSFSFANGTEGDLVRMLGGDGGSQVDLVLYMILESMFL